MIPGFDLTAFAASAGPWAAIFIVALIIFSESGLLIGFFLPGDSILFTVGFLIQGGVHLQVPLAAAIAIFFVAAVLGDSVGYAFGKRVGPHIFTRPNSFLFRQENIKKAEEFFAKYGAKTIIFARFVPVVRTFAPIVAGVSSMTYKTFLTFNIIGAALWAAGVTMLGFFLGGVLERMGVQIDTVLLPIIIVILIASIAPALIHLLRDKKQRALLWKGVKRQFAFIFGRKK
jgi:membrane-associated protein